MVLLKYLTNFWTTLEMSLNNLEINHDLNWSKKLGYSRTNDADQDTTCSISDTKLHVLLVTLSTQDNAKLLEQLKSGFERKINWNKYQSKISTERSNQSSDYLIDPSFQGVNRLFVLSFENEGQRTKLQRILSSDSRDKKI